MMTDRHTDPKTIRQQIMDHLQGAELSALELSACVGIPEKEVSSHLEHIGKTAAARGMRLVLHPFRCLSCGYLFKDRKRFSRPGRCPKCKGSHLETPTFRIL